jgi:hypothetical protein
MEGYLNRSPGCFSPVEQLTSSIITRAANSFLATQIVRFVIALPRGMSHFIRNNVFGNQYKYKYNSRVLEYS